MPLMTFLDTNKAVQQYTLMEIFGHGQNEMDSHTPDNVCKSSRLFKLIIYFKRVHLFMCAND